MNAVDRFIEEIRAAPGFATAALKEPRWNDDLDELQHVFDVLRRSDLDCSITASDRIAETVGDKSVPIKQRLLAVTDIMRDAMR